MGDPKNSLKGMNSVHRKTKTAATHLHDPVSVLIVAERSLGKQVREITCDALGKPGVTPGFHGDEAAKELLGDRSCHQLPRDHRLVNDVWRMKQVCAERKRKILQNIQH